jgi:hypothetical protein
MVQRMTLLVVVVFCILCSQAVGATSELYVSSRDNSGALGYLTHLTISGNVVVTARPPQSFFCPPARSGIAYTLKGDFVYFACGDTVTAVRTRDDTLVAFIPVTQPGELFVRAGDKQLFVAQPGGVTIIDITLQLNGLRTNTVLKTIKYPRNEATSAVLFGGNAMFASTLGGSVFKYNSNHNPPLLLAQLQYTVPVQTLGLNANASKAYAFLSDGSVEVLNSSNLSTLQTLQCALAEPESTLLVRTRYLYTPQNDGSLCAIDTTTDLVINPILAVGSLGSFLGGLRWQGNKLYIPDANSNTTVTVKLGTTPSGDMQGVSFGNLPANTFPIGVAIHTTVSSQQTWTQKFPTNVPPVGAGHAMTFDAARNEVVLFGGIACDTTCTVNFDVWVWDGSNWTMKPTTTKPTSAGGAMVYDAARSQVVLAQWNGFTDASSALETWIWDGSSWTKQSPATNPPPREAFAMAYDSTRGQAVLFGGLVPTGLTDLNDTWTWDGTNWTQKFPATSPSARLNHVMAYDTARSQVVLFGGSHISTGTTFSDTWVWDGSTWSQKSPVASPSARQLHAMAYDSVRGEVVLFGGLTAGGLLNNETWGWAGVNWTQKLPSMSPSPRYEHAMAFDASHGQIVLDGGSQLKTGDLSDTWVWPAP